MSGRFLSPKDIAAAKYETEVFNSLLKRGKIKDPEKIVRLMHIVCGCGATGCIFTHATRKEPEPA